jgi:hypothetical protein
MSTSLDDRLQAARRPRFLRSSRDLRARRVVNEYPVGYLAQLARPLAAGERSTARAYREARARLRPTA